MHIEILAPCGGPESLEAALRAGADAVYLGAKEFSARKNADNFSDDELKTAVRECHRHGVLVYLAFNTVIKDNELKRAYKLLGTACSAGVDGLIIQDFAVYEAARTACPDMPLHASTQMTIHTRMGARAAKELGFKRVVAARELPLCVIKELCGEDIEVEVFAHGALCMSVSGQCYLSAMIGGRSANRGLCVGACRLPFSAAGMPKDEYALSLKDLSYCKHVNDLADAGVRSLKIEGRMKRPEYVAAAVNALKCSLSGEDYDEKSLRAVFSRSGFTDGYLDSKTGAGMFGARLKEDVTAAADALGGLRKLYEKPEKRFKLDMKLSAHHGEPMTLWASGGGCEAIVKGDVPEEASASGTDRQKIEEQLSKFGGTIYEPGDISVDADGGIFIPLSRINLLRRMAVEALDSERADRLFKPIAFDASSLKSDFERTSELRYPALRIRAESPEQLSLTRPEGEELVIPLSKAKEFFDSGYDPKNCAVSLPRFDVDEKKTAEALGFAKTLGFCVVECSNIGQIALAKSLGMTPIGGFGLNISNSPASRHYFDCGVKTQVLSPELKAVQCSFIASPARLGATVYGHLPLMIMRNCPIAAQVGCKNCRKKLTDRTGAEFPVVCRRQLGIYELLNPKPLWMADRLNDLNLDFCDIMLTNETPEEAERIIWMFRRGEPPYGEFTRGRFYKGVE